MIARGQPTVSILSTIAIKLIYRGVVERNGFFSFLLRN